MYLPRRKVRSEKLLKKGVESREEGGITLIAEDDSLGLKTLTNEGVVLIVYRKRLHRFPLLHFIGRIKW